MYLINQELINASKTGKTDDVRQILETENIDVNCRDIHNQIILM